MTAELLMDEIWQHGGEPADLDPDTDVQLNGGPLLYHVINEAQRRVSAWKDSQNGRIMRFRTLIADPYFKTFYLTNTLDDDAGTGNQTLPSTDVSGHDDRYNGFILEVGGESNLIVDYDGTSYLATMHQDWVTEPDSGDTYYLYKNFQLLLPSGHNWAANHITLPTEATRANQILSVAPAEGSLIEVLKIIDLEDSRVLEKLPGKEFNINNLFSSGDPTGWIRIGNKIYFDRPTKEEKWFKMEYYRTPTPMAALVDTPEIPEEFQYAIVLWGMWWMFNRQGDMSTAWAKKQDFTDFMRTTKSTYDIELERADDFGSMTLG